MVSLLITCVLFNNNSKSVSKGSTIKFEGDDMYIDKDLGACAIFIGEILAGYLIDGVLIYTTGYSGGELFSQGLQALYNLLI